MANVPDQKSESKSVKLSRSLATIPIDRYRMAKDARKWKAVAQNRMALAEFLGNHGDGDGTRIFPAVATMAKKFGWSESKTYYLLDDLRKLRLLEDTPHYSAPKFHRTRVRQLNVAAFLTVQDSKIEVGLQDSNAQNAQDSKIESQDSKIEVQDSNVTLETTATVNRHSDRHKVNFGLGVHSRVHVDKRAARTLEEYQNHYGAIKQRMWAAPSKEEHEQIRQELSDYEDANRCRWHRSHYFYNGPCPHLHHATENVTAHMVHIN